MPNLRYKLGTGLICVDGGVGWVMLGITAEETGQSPGFISPTVGISVHVDTTNTDWWH